MIIKKIKITNWKIFKGVHEFSFDKLNSIKGDNGSGKSTLGLESIMFCFWGHSKRNIKDLINKFSKHKRAEVAIEVDNLIVIREIPTKLTIIEDGIEKKFPTNREAQNYICERYGTIDYFKKFRMIDVIDGINILEEGNTSLIKILCSHFDEYLNDIRTKLEEKRTYKSKLNIDDVKIYSLFPSEKRFNYLKTKVKELEGKYNLLNTTLQKHKNDYHLNVSKRSNLERDLKRVQDTIKRLDKEKLCPTCRTILNSEQEAGLIENYRNDTININKNISETIDIINMAVLEGRKYKERVEYLEKKISKIKNLIMKLEVRLKQKHFIYTTRDIEITKKAISKINEFSNSYVVRYVKNLEPIINNLIKMIEFSVKFEIDDKRRLEIILYKNETKYSYDDLSNGQKLILATAFQLAILLERGQNGLIIADEGFSSLSETNLEKVLDIFKNFPFQLIYIIHQSSVSPEGAKEITL